MSDQHVKINDIRPWIAHQGDGDATAFAAPFAFFAAEDLEVRMDGVLQALDTDYTVDGAGETGGGTVTFGAPPANGAAVVVARRTAVERTSDFLPGGALRADVLNGELDRLTAIAQELRNRLDHAVRLTGHDAGAPLAPLPAKTALADRLLAFDASGEPVAGPLSASLNQVENVATLEAQAGASAASAEASAAAAAEDADGIAALVQNIPAVSSFTGDGVETDFTLGAAPVDKLALLVAVDGVLQPASAYAVAGTALSFAAAPADGAAIEVRDLSSTATVDAADVAALAPLGAAIAALGPRSGELSEVADGLNALGESALTAARSDYGRRHPDIQPPALLIAPGLGHGHGLMGCVRDGAATTVDAGRRLRQVASDVTRLWHDPATGRALFLLNEAGAANLCLQSADLSAAPWSDTGAPVMQSGARAPDGSVSSRIVDNESGAAASRRQIIDLSAFEAGDAVTVSGWVRRSDSGVYPAVRVEVFDDDTPSANELFDAVLLPFSTQQTSDLNGAWDAAGFEAWPDGWIRCWGRIVLPDPAPQALGQLNLRAFPAWNSSDSPSGNSGAQGHADFFGFQVESGPRASSYIPTATEQATRPAERLQAAIPEPPASGALTLMVRYRYLGGEPGGESHAHVLAVGDATDGADEYLVFRHGQAGDAAAHQPDAMIYTAAGGLDMLGAAAARTAGASVALAVAMDSAGSVFEVDGDGELDGAAPTLPDPDRLTHLIAGAKPSLAWGVSHNVGIEEFALWPVKLADADLTEITA